MQRAIWLVGGGAINGQMLQAGLIDRIVLRVFPIFLGQGIPLFGTAPIPDTILQNAQTQHFPNGIQQFDWRRPCS